jgi:MoaA/NifB/PqqE/SkfB family radical SAM enzyme
MKDKNSLTMPLGRAARYVMGKSIRFLLHSRHATQLGRGLLSRHPGIKAKLLHLAGKSSQEVAEDIQRRIDHELLRKAQAMQKRSVYANLPSLARPGRIDKLVFQGYSRPLSLAIETTNICNNNCVVCSYSSQTRARETMSLSLFEKILQDYKALGGGDLSFTPLVGEVLLDKYLPTRLEMVKKMGFIRRLSVHSNGVMARLYDDPALKYIVQSFDRFKISIYGLDSEEYKAMTRKDEYESAMENISRILRNSKGNVVFGIRHLKRRSAEDVAKWIEDLRTRSECQYPVEITEQVLEEYSNWGFLGEVNLPFDARWRPNPINKKQCLIPLLAPKITSTGDVSYCSCANFDASEQLTLGNIHNNSLKQLYNSQKCQKLYSWEIFGIPEFCRACSFYTSIDTMENWPTLFSDPPLN